MLVAVVLLIAVPEVLDIVDVLLLSVDVLEAKLFASDVLLMAGVKLATEVELAVEVELELGAGIEELAAGAEELTVVDVWPDADVELIDVTDCSFNEGTGDEAVEETLGDDVIGVDVLEIGSDEMAAELAAGLKVIGLVDVVGVIVSDCVMLIEVFVAGLVKALDRLLHNIALVEEKGTKWPGDGDG